MEKGESSGLPAGGEDYKQATEKLIAFLQSFEEDDLDGQVERKYVKKLQEVANRLTRVVEIFLDDVEANLGDEMAGRIERNAHRYKQLFADAIDSVMPEPTVDIVDEDVADGKPAHSTWKNTDRCRGKKRRRDAYLGKMMTPIGTLPSLPGKG